MRIFQEIRKVFIEDGYYLINDSGAQSKEGAGDYAFPSIKMQIRDHTGIKRDAVINSTWRNQDLGDEGAIAEFEKLFPEMLFHGAMEIWKITSVHVDRYSVWLHFEDAYGECENVCIDVSDIIPITKSGAEHTRYCEDLHGTKQETKLIFHFEVPDGCHDFESVDVCYSDEDEYVTIVEHIGKGRRVIKIYPPTKKGEVGYSYGSSVSPAIIADYPC